MSYTKKYKVSSNIDPDKIYSSATEFWDDFRTEVGDPNNIIADVNTLEISNLKNPANLNSKYETQGKIISEDSILSSDGKSVIFTKVYKDEQSYIDYMKDLEILYASNSNPTEIDSMQWDELDT